MANDRETQRNPNKDQVRTLIWYKKGCFFAETQKYESSKDYIVPQC